MHSTSSCLKTIAEVRRDALGHRFFEALTRGGDRDAVRPIELQAHDPLRYAGDMLAWVHQSAASELELLATLMRYEDQKSNSVLTSYRPQPGEDSSVKTDAQSMNTSVKQKELIELIDHSFEVVSRTLKV